MTCHDGSYQPNVFARDLDLERENGWHRIDGLGLGYATVFLVMCDEGCLHLAAVSDEYGMRAVEWSAVVDQANNLSSGVDTS